MASTDPKSQSGPALPPVPTLQQGDWIVAHGAAQYHSEQADLGAETIWHEMRKKLGEIGEVRAEYEKRLANLRNPRILLKKSLRVARDRVYSRVVQPVRRLSHAQTGWPRVQLPAFRDIQFARVDKPVVSVVIPVYNLLPITLDCLRSIARAHESTPYEIIVVDDASPDPMVQPILKRVAGIVYVRQQTNGGFVNSCNAGAARARGEIIYFLNNDTTVKDNWLAPIVKTYQDATIGAVGSKILYPHGTLAEAGGIVFNTAEGWNYGRTDTPDRPEYDFLRDVDYCSGAALSIRRELFEKIGGFNRQLAPGYYEDVELCFATRELGYRVVYQPRSVIVHYEGASSASNVTEGKKPMKAYQEVNFHKFKRMRAKELTQQWPKDLRLLPLIVRRKRGLRIWVFDWFIPTPDQDYGSARMLEILKVLAKDHTVTFIPRDLTDKPTYRKVLEDLGIEVYPRGLGSNFTIRAKIEGPHLDLAIFSRPEVMHYFYHLVRQHAPQARTIFDTVDVHHVRWQRELATTKDPAKRDYITKQIEYYKLLEKEYCTRADRIWAITPADQAIFKEFVPGKAIDVVGAAQHIRRDVAEYTTREGLVYIGSFYHPPNVASVEHFINDINPILQQLQRGTTLTVIGGPVPEHLKRLAQQRSLGTVRFVGRVDQAELDRLYARAKVFVSPLLSGSGLKGKVVMAMASGLPVVATSISAEGIPVQDGQHMSIADDPRSFAQKVVELYNDGSLWRRYSEAGRTIVDQNYGPARFAKQIQDSLKALA